MIINALILMLRTNANSASKNSSQLAIGISTANHISIPCMSVNFATKSSIILLSMSRDTEMETNNNQQRARYDVNNSPWLQSKTDSTILFHKKKTKNKKSILPLIYSRLL